MDLGAVARSDLRVRQLPGRFSCQAGPQTSFPAPMAPLAPGPPFPRGQRPEASWEGKVREVQGGAEGVAVQFRKIWKHVHDLLTE